MEEITDVRGITLRYRRKKLFKKLQKFGTETGFDVAAIVFSTTGYTNEIGNISVLDRFMADVVGSGGYLELDEGMVKLIWLGFEKLEEEVKRSFDSYRLIAYNNELQRLKDVRLKGVLSDEETAARASESSSAFLNMLDSRQMSKMDSLARKLTKISIFGEVDAFFICATKGSEACVSRYYHTCPGHGPSFLKLIHKFKKACLKKAENPMPQNFLATENSKSLSIVADENPSPQSVNAAVKQMLDDIVAAEKSGYQAIATALNPTSQASVATKNPKSLTIFDADDDPSPESIKADVKQMVQRLVATEISMSKTIPNYKDAISQAIASHGNSIWNTQAATNSAISMPRVNVAAGNAMPHASVSAMERKSDTVSYGAIVSKINGIVKLLDAKLLGLIQSQIVSKFR